MRNNIILSAAFAAVSLVLSACTNVATFDYQAAPGTLAKLREPGSATKSVAVMPFMDQRGIGNFDPALAASAHDVGDHGSFFLGFIPPQPEDCRSFYERISAQLEGMPTTFLAASAGDTDLDS